MHSRIRIGLLAFTLAFTGVTTTAFAKDHELPLKDGATWRGADGDEVKVVFSEQGVEQSMTGTLESIQGREGFEIIVVKGLIAGRDARKAIFAPDILSLTTVKSGDGGADVADLNTKPIPGTGTKDSTKGVFYMPWSGMVGIGARHDEFEQLAAEADKLGPGQTIVIQIDSGGGLVLEGDEISKSLIEIKKRHRLVAWIKKAISAAAFTAMHCDEIYFMKSGNMGSIVMFSGQTAISGVALQEWIKELAKVAEIGGRSPIPAVCMVTRTKMASYDKDPDTGKINWYPDMRGEFDISDANNVLSLNAENAVHCGYADGVAETKEELAALLDLEEWNEINPSGQKIYDDWQGTVKKGRDELPKLFARMEYKGTASGDQEVVLGTRIQLYQDIIRWYDRCEPLCKYEFGFPPKSVMERQLLEMKKQLGDMRRARRNR
jgi:ATP-dependent protease ClpP protease subunit